jgi:ParB family chromosome partitioning protein
VSKDRRLGRGLAALLGTPLEGESSADSGLAGPAEILSGPGTPAGDDGGAPRIVQMPQAKSQPPATPASAPDGSAPGANPVDLPTDAPKSKVPGAADAPQSDFDVETAGLLQLAVDQIDDNPFQPRRDFSEPEIASLAESLKQHDMLQPVLVRRIGKRYQLISGERRLRAAIRAGWKSIPARVREADDRLVAELAIVENLQRQDLNAVEKAMSFRRYLDQHECTQEDLASRLKIDRSTIANLLRLLELPERVLGPLREGTISAGHARALLPLGDEPLQVEFCSQIKDEGWSVRETERRVQEKIFEEDGAQSPEAGGKSPKKRRTVNQQIASLEQELRRAMGTKVELRQTGKGRGRIVVHFANHDEFDRIWALLVGELEAHGQSQVG